jgi:hypothetical protein
MVPAKPCACARSSCRPYLPDWKSVKFDKKLTIAVLIGTLPLLAATIWCAMLIGAARRYGGGADALMMAMLCAVTYGFACLVLIPSIGVVIDRRYRRKLPLERRARAITWLAALTLLLPPAAVNGLYYLLPGAM